MTRDDFTAGFAQRMRFVAQKVERIVDAKRRHSPEGEAAERIALESAIQELADFTYDAVGAAQ